MRLFARRDAFLLVGLTAALLIIFAAPISRLLDYTRDIERQSGLSLLPALVVLTVVYRLPPAPEAPRDSGPGCGGRGRQAARPSGEPWSWSGWWRSAMRWPGRSTTRRLATPCGQHLPRVAGTDHVWVLLYKAAKWECSARRRPRRRRSHPSAKPLPTGCWPAAASMSDAGQTTGFPLVVGGAAVGVLGIGSEELLDPDRHRAIEAAAALLAVSLKNAQLFTEVRENSWRDALTGCVTRTYATEVMDAELRRARRSKNPDLGHPLRPRSLQVRQRSIRPSVRRRGAGRRRTTHA